MHETITRDAAGDNQEREGFILARPPGPIKPPREAAAEMAALGQQRLEAGDLDNAAALLSAALDQDPDCYAAVLDLGVLAGKRGHVRAGLALASRAVALRPGDPAGWNNLGSNLMQLQRYEEAEAALKRVPEIDSSLEYHHHNLGLTYFYMNHSEEAVVHLRRAVEFYERTGKSTLGARSDLSLATMKAGRFHAGLELNECRWDGMLPRLAPWSCGAPKWEGQALSYQTILVHAEQGFGDTIQFCRFLPDLRAQGATVILAVPGPLVRFLAGQEICDEVVDVGSLANLVRVSREISFHSPLLSVVRHLGVEFDSLPPAAKPYLRTVDPAPDRRPREVRGVGFRVGIAWCGSPGYQRNGEKSARLEDLLPLAEVPGARLYSLQVGAFAGDVRNIGVENLVVDLTGQIDDFADAADVVSQLDLVVSVDTAAFHLSAALGRPTWLMQSVTPCWRWRRGVKPWYGSAEEYHQVRPGSWTEPVAEMRRDLERLVGDRSS